MDYAVRLGRQSDCVGSVQRLLMPHKWSSFYLPPAVSLAKDKSRVHTILMAWSELPYINS